MSSTPPPPPPPPPAVPPAGGPQAFDPKSVNQFDWGILGIGVLLLIFSFFAYYTLDAGPISDSTGGWHFSNGSFIGWFAFIVGLAGSAVVALSIFVPSFKLPVPTYVAAIGLFLLSFVLYLIGFFAIGPDTSGAPKEIADAIDDAFGFGFSYWASFILVIVGAVLSFLRAQQTNTALPGPLGNIPKLG